MKLEDFCGIKAATTINKYSPFSLVLQALESPEVKFMNDKPFHTPFHAPHFPTFWLQTSARTAICCSLPSAGLYNYIENCDPVHKDV